MMDLQQHFVPNFEIQQSLQQKEPVMVPECPDPESAQTHAQERSYFDGSTWQLIGWRLLIILLGILTLGLAAPWCQCMLYRWEAKHTVINGKRLRFDGKGLQYLGKSLLWGLLSLITCGIYAIFIPVKMKKWHTSHLHFADTRKDEEPQTPVWPIVLMVVAVVLVIGLVVGGIFMLTGHKATNTGSGQDWLNRGNSSLEMQDYDTAVQAFSSAIAANPDQAAGYIGRAEAYVSMGDLDAAMADMESAQSRDDGSYDSQIQELLLLLQVLQSVQAETLPQETDSPQTLETEPEKELPQQVYYVHAKGGLNLRKEPDKKSKALLTIPNGTAVVPMDWADNGWAKVSYKGKTGWCSGDYLKTQPPEQEPEQKPSAQSGYTWAQILQAQADSKAKINSYRGRKLSKGFTSMTAEKALQLYEDMIQGKYYPRSDFTGDLLKILDPPEDYGNLYTYSPMGISFDELCSYYFTYFADDYAAAQMREGHWGVDNTYMELDGVCYRKILGIGDAGVPTEYTLHVQEQDDAFIITMEVDTYWNDEHEPPEHWTATHKCILEDGHWVLDGFTTPYL